MVEIMQGLIVVLLAGLAIVLLFLVYKFIEEQIRWSKVKKKTVHSFLQEMKGQQLADPDPFEVLLRKEIANGKKRVDEQIRATMADIDDHNNQGDTQKKGG